MSINKECYADVIVDITSEKLDRVFQYRIPDEMRGKVEPGMVVEIEFGKGNRLIKGYVVSLSETCNFAPEKIKPLKNIVTDGTGGETTLMRLAAWMKQYYGSTAIQALRTVIPVRKKIKPQEKKTIVLKLPEQQVKQALALMRQKHQVARARLLEALAEESSLPWDLVRDKLNITPDVVKALEKQNVITVETERVYRGMGTEGGIHAKRVTLNSEQQAIVSAITGEWDQETPWKGRYLIHGITGSGKTEVYMELIAYAIERGQQAIVLIPEIALTYQTLMRFYRRFGDQVSVINSKMTPGERFDQFERAKKGEISVMIGPRSALFTPFANLGIIVIDEEHEGAYISEQSPRYHADEVAFERGRIEGARVILGSATPRVDTYFAAKTNQIRLFAMTERAGGAQLPDTQIVDMRQELKEGRRSIVSRLLEKEINECLERNEQAMLFINRRGMAGFVSCRSCGHVLKCPHCDVAMTVHRSGKMICHYCGHNEPVTKTCPECGSPFLRQFKVGTEAIEDELNVMFPKATVLRMDMDTTKSKDSYTKILSAFASHEADILLGTQMIVKGHDFPDVTLVGVLAADMSLNIPDFRAAERTFQLITQAAGRAGRRERSGHVVIQTYEPDNYSIECSAKQDYEAFYETEMSYRMLAGYPPAGAMAAIHVSGPDESYLAMSCDYLAKYANMLTSRWGGSVLGPTDETISKIQDIYRKVIYLRHNDPEILSRLRLGIEKYIDVNPGFASVSVQFERC